MQEQRGAVRKRPHPDRREERVQAESGPPGLVLREQDYHSSAELRAQPALERRTICQDERANEARGAPAGGRRSNPANAQCGMHRRLHR